jgi:hypothetical protein
MIDIAWFRPDIIVAIGRGNYLAARILSVAPDAGGCAGVCRRLKGLFS